MAVVGEAFVTVHALTAGMEKEIAAGVDRATKGAGSAKPITPNVNTKPAEKEFGRLESALNGVQKKFKSVAEEGGPLSSKLASLAEGATALGPAGIAAGLGLAALVGVAFHGIGEFTTLANQIKNFSILSGAGAEDSSRFVIALKELGLQPEKIGAGLFKLGQQIGNGTDKLAKNNIEVVRTKNGNVDMVATFLNVSEAVHNATNATDKSAIAFNAFGRQGKDLVPILDRGSDALKEFLQTADRKGLVFNAEEIEKAREYQIALRGLGESVESVEISLGRQLIPVLSEAAETTAVAIDAARKHKFALHDLPIEAQAAVAGVHAFHYAVDKLSGGELTAASKSKSLAAAIKEDNDAALAAATSINTLRTAVVTAVQAQGQFDSSTRNVTKAHEAVADAQAAYNKVVKEGKIDEKEVQRARDALTDSTDSLRDADERLAKAQDTLNKAQQGATPRDLEQANLRVSETANSAARAAEALADLQRKHRVDALDLSDAQNAVGEANIAQANAVDELTKLQQKGTDTDQDVIDAQNGVSDAAEAAAKATRQRVDASKDLAAALAGDPDFDDKLAKAARGVRDAQSQVSDAEIARTIAAVNLQTAMENEQTAFEGNAGAVKDLRDQLLDLANEYQLNIAPFIAGLFQFREALSGKPPTSNPAANSYAPGAFGQGPLFGNPDGHAEGGNVQANHWYGVNERGQEFFKSDSSGTIIPVGGNYAGGGGGPVINNYVTESKSPAATAGVVSIYTARALRTTGR